MFAEIEVEQQRTAPANATNITYLVKPTCDLTNRNLSKEEQSKCREALRDYDTKVKADAQMSRQDQIDATRKTADGLKQAATAAKKLADKAALDKAAADAKKKASNYTGIPAVRPISLAEDELELALDFSKEE